MIELRPGWSDDGTNLVGPPSPIDGKTYPFTDSSGMREIAVRLLRSGIMTPDDTAIENAEAISANRVEQCTVYTCLVVENDAQGQWHAFRSNIGAEHRAHRTTQPTVIIPTVEAVPAAPTDPNKIKLARSQQFLGGENKLGVYCGIWTFGKNAQQMVPIARNIKAWGFDYAYLKFEESGVQFFPSPISDYRKVFADEGLHVIPYIYDRPQYTQVDIDTALRLIDVFGGIDFDLEEVFLGFGTQLTTLINEVRAQRPQAIIIADGYGDPISAFGSGGFPYAAIKHADCYQPQWYESFMYGGLPGSMTWAQWQAGLDNNDAQCGQEFVRAGLGESFPIRPCVDFVMSAEVAFNVGQWAAKFGLGLTVWEYKYCTAPLVAALKAGLMKGLGR